jgi:hypothetical protein
MRGGSNVQLAALRNWDLELQTTSPFSNHGSVERSTACCRHKSVLHVWIFQNFQFVGSPCTYYTVKICRTLPIHLTLIEDQVFMDIGSVKQFRITTQHSKIM